MVTTSKDRATAFDEAMQRIRELLEHTVADMDAGNIVTAAWRIKRIEDLFAKWGIKG